MSKQRIDVDPVPSVGRTIPVACYVAGIRPDEWAASVDRDEAEQERRARDAMVARITAEMAKQAHRASHTTEPL